MMLLTTLTSKACSQPTTKNCTLLVSPRLVIEKENSFPSIEFSQADILITYLDLYYSAISKMLFLLD